MDYHSTHYVSMKPSNLETIDEDLTLGKLDFFYCQESIERKIAMFDRLESVLLGRAEAKEKELRHLLLSRSTNSDLLQTTSIIDDEPTTTPSNDQPFDKTVAFKPVNNIKVLSSSSNLVTLARPTTNSPNSLLRRPQLPTTTPSNALWPSVNHQSPPQPTLPIVKHVGGLLPTPNSSPLVAPTTSTSYRHHQIDPCVDLVLKRLIKAQLTCRSLVEANQLNLQSFTFTQNSQNGKRIMLRVRVLEQENEELANSNRTGRSARLESEISLRRAVLRDLKQCHSEMEFFVDEMDEETESLGNTLLLLQQRVNFAKSTASLLAEAVANRQQVKSEATNSCSNDGDHLSAIDQQPSSSSLLAKSSSCDSTSTTESDSMVCSTNVEGHLPTANQLIHQLGSLTSSNSCGSIKRSRSPSPPLSETKRRLVDCEQLDGGREVEADLHSINGSSRDGN